MKFVVDTSDVAKGFRDYRSAVEGIFTSLDKFEAHVKSTLSGVARAAGNQRNLNGFKRSLEAFGNIKVDGTAARKLSALSAALQGFRAPSAAQTTNTKQFMKAVGSLPDLGAAHNAVRTINNLKTAMDGFKAPASAQSKRLVDFANSMKLATPALRGMSAIAGISGIANELASISIAMKNLKPPSAGQVTNLGNMALALRSFNFSNLAGSGNFYAALGAISNFKAPSAAQIRNLQSFVTAVANMKIPAGNTEKVAAALNRIAVSATNASQSMTRLRGGLGSVGNSLGRVGTQARGATIQMMGLQNAFSGTFQIGSALRTLFGSLTIAELGRNFFEASNAALAFKGQMDVITKSAGFAANQLAWVDREARNLGLDMITAEKGFGKLSIAADKSGLAVGQTREIFTGFGTAMTVLGTSTERQNDVFLALQQVMNKGYLSAEELNQQLNEHLPGAMGIAAEFAETLGLSLEEGLKKKALEADEVLGFMARRMREDFGPALEAALKRPDVQMTILRSGFDKLFQKIGEFGGNQAFGNFLKTINDSMTPEDIDRYAKAWGETLFHAVNKVTDAFVWFRDNWDSIKGPLAAGLKIFATWSIVSGTFQLGRFFVAPLLGAAGAVRPLIPMMWDLVGATRALSAANLTQFYTQLATIKDPRIVQGVSSLSIAMGNLSGTRTGTALAGAGKAVGAIGTAAKAAAPIVTRLAGVLGSGLAAAWLVGQKAAEDSVDRQVSLNFTASEIISGMWFNATDWIRQKWGEMTDAIADFGSWLAEKIGINFSDIGTFAARTAVGIAYVFNRMGDGLVRLFAAAGLAVANTLMGIGRSVNALFEGDVDTALAEAWGVVNGNAAVDGFKSAFGGFKFGGGDFNRFYEEVGGGFASTVNFLNSQGARGRAEANRGRRDGPSVNFDMMSDAETALLGGGDRGNASLNSEAGGAGGSGGGRGGRGQTAEQRAQSILNNARTLMNMFSEVDPLGQLYTDFVETIHEQSQILLNDQGYKNFLANIKQDALAGMVGVQSLIDVLHEGGNLSGDTLNALRDRYGKDVEDIIGLLISQQAAYEKAVKEATVKALDFQFSASTDMIAAIGDLIPSVQAMGEAISTLTPLAQSVLPNDAFAEWAENLRSGFDDAISSSEDLADRVLNLAGKSPVLDSALKTLGITAQEYADAVTAAGRATDYARRIAQRDQGFGAVTLRSMDEEIALLGLRDREADIMQQLSDATKDYLAAGEKLGPLSSEMVGDLEQQIRKRQELADLLQREKEHFENNGIRSYLNDLQSAGQAAQELDKNVLQSLEDQLFSLGTTGKFSFGAIFDTIQQGIVRFASQDITRALTEGLSGGRENLEGGNPSLFSGLFSSLGFDTGAAGVPLGSQGNPMLVKMADPLGIDLRTGDLVNSSNPTVSVDGYTTSSVYQPGGNTGSIDPTSVGATAATIENTAEKTASSFGESMVGMMPLIGVAFASTFKSPIAQIGVTFASMIIQKLLASGGSGGGGGGGGLLGSLVNIGLSAFAPGAGAASSLTSSVAGAFAANPGIFKEGGYTGSPVARARAPASLFSGVPHYSEGTANTSGGQPAILHDNEAVIPLSRNRKVAVELNGNSGAKGVTNVWNIQTPNADSFQKSRQQLVSDMHAQANRAYARNN